MIAMHSMHWNPMKVLPDAVAHFEHELLFRCGIGPRLAKRSRVD
jgi:hypothetical protein